MERIIFYDGNCGFCSSTVQFILKSKKNKDFYFAPLQSKYAENILKQKGIKIEMDTFYYLKKNKLYDKSSAGLQVCKDLKFPYPLLFVFYFTVPKFIRDYFYSIIAKNRLKLKGENCLLPSLEEKKYFIRDND